MSHLRRQSTETTALLKKSVPRTSRVALRAQHAKRDKEIEARQANPQGEGLIMDAAQNAVMRRPETPLSVPTQQSLEAAHARASASDTGSWVCCREISAPLAQPRRAEREQRLPYPQRASRPVRAAFALGNSDVRQAHRRLQFHGSK